MDQYDELASLLTAYFCNQFYSDGICALQRDIKRQKSRAELWGNITSTIHGQTLLPGQPLELVNQKANQVLEANTDQEAYRWLDLMVQNVQRTDGEIQTYAEVYITQEETKKQDIAPALSEEAAPPPPKSPSNLEIHLRTLHGIDPGKRAKAAGALAKMGQKMIEPLIASFRREKVRPRSIEAAASLLRPYEDTIADRMLDAQKDKYGGVRALALEILLRINSQDALKIAAKAADDPHPLVWSRAIQTLQQRGDAANLAGLVRKDSACQSAAALALGRLQDRRAIEPLIENLNNDDWTVRLEAVQLLQQLALKYRDWRCLPAFAAILENEWETIEIWMTTRDALRAIRKEIYPEGQAFIDLIFQSSHQWAEEGEQALLYIDAQPGDPFTFETYKVFIDQVAAMQRNYRFPLGNVRVSKVPERLMLELPSLYQSNLPDYVLARCPICGGQVSEHVDTFSLAGLGWWLSEPNGFGWMGRRLKDTHKLRPFLCERGANPSYRAECEHVQAVHYGVNFHAIIPDDVMVWSLIITGSEKPGILQPFMQQTDSYAVLHALPIGRLDDIVWQPHYTVYFVSYFSPHPGAFEASLAPQNWYDNNFAWPYEQMDYDLPPWVEQGKLLWLGDAEEGYPLQRKNLNAFPYSEVEGLEGRWRLNRQKGATLLPKSPARLLYNRSAVSTKNLKPVQDKALRQRGFKSIRREQVGHAVAFMRQQNQPPKLDMSLLDLDLSEMDLSGIILKGQRLSGTNFREARLCGADLSNTTLVNVDLRGADMRDAKLSGVEMQNIKFDEKTLWPDDYEPR